MGQISAKFAIKVVVCFAPPPLSPPPARTHLPPPRPHSPLYSAITAGLSAATLTNDSLTADRIRCYRNISFSLQSGAGSAAADAVHHDYGSSSDDASGILVQVVLTSRLAHVTSTTSTMCRLSRCSCAWNVRRRGGRVRVCARNCPTDQLRISNRFRPEQPISLRVDTICRPTYDPLTDFRTHCQRAQDLLEANRASSAPAGAKLALTSRLRVSLCGRASFFLGLTRFGALRCTLSRSVQYVGHGCVATLHATGLGRRANSQKLHKSLPACNRSHAARVWSPHVTVPAIRVCLLCAPAPVPRHRLATRRIQHNRGNLPSRKVTAWCAHTRVRACAAALLARVPAFRLA